MRNGVPEAQAHGRGPHDAPGFIVVAAVDDSAIHHFSEPEASAILSCAQALLRPAGVLSGYTIIEPHAEYAYTRMRFSSPEELAKLLERVFAHVAVLETPDALRRNLYFFASDTREALPFALGVKRRP